MEQTRKLSEYSDEFFDTWLIKLAETGRPIQIAVEGVFNHPSYGKIDWSIERLQRYKENFDTNVRGQKIPVNVEHIPDNPEGSAGWWKSCEFMPVKWIDGSIRQGLFVFIEWTDYGRRLVEDKRFLYISPEFFNSWTHPETGQKFKDVMIACALTIQPFIKGMQEVILSEKPTTETVSLIEETEESVKMADKPKDDEEKPESIEDLLKQHDAVVNKISECIKGKKGVTAARHQIKMSKKLLDELYEAHFKSDENKESEATKAMNEEKTVNMAEIEAMKVKMAEMEAQQKALSEKAKLAESQAQRLAELEAENMKMVVDSKVNYLREQDLIKPGEAEVVRQQFMEFAEMSEAVRLSEGKNTDILGKVVTLMEKACHKLTLNTKAQGTGTVETEPEAKEKKTNLSQVDQILKFAEENKIGYHEAVAQMRLQGIGIKPFEIPAGMPKS